METLIGTSNPQRHRPSSAHQNDFATIETIIGTALFFISILVGLFVAQKRGRKLNDPEDHDIVYTHQLEKIAQLAGPGSFVVRTFRQSGNQQQADKIVATAEQAIKSAISTFNRAKIDHVIVDVNTPTTLSFRRSFHCHRGRNEGKKVGLIEIRRI